MKPKRDFKVGDRVWCMEGTYKPLLGTIQRVEYDGIFYYVDHDEKIHNNVGRVYTSFRIYKYPEDRMYLVEELREDAQYFNDYANMIEKEGEC